MKIGNESVSTVVKNQAQRICLDMVKKAEEVLAKTELNDTAKTQLRNEFLTELDHAEYITISTLDGLCHIHPNPFREGMVFLDDVAKKALAANDLLFQIYHRDTGEVLLDVAHPVMVHGKKAYVLRVGTVITKGSQFQKNALMALIPLIPLGAAAYMEVGFSPVLLTGIGISALAAAIVASVITSQEKKIVSKVQHGMKRVAVGDLTFSEKSVERTEMGQLVFEINKLNAGLKGLVTNLLETAAQILKGSVNQETATEEVQKSIESIAASVEQISASSQEQSASVEDIAGFISDVADKMKSLDGNMSEALSSCEEGDRKGREGQRAIRETTEQMRRIQETFTHSTDVINQLDEKSEKISIIIDTISDIAAQTNLLALNAAIEAARAGEQGRGFAVVADEVRKLAENSDQSAQEIVQIITENKKHTKEAVTIMNQGTEKLEAGSRLVEDTGKRVEDIIESINRITGQISENKQMTVEISGSAQELEHKSASVKESTEAVSLAMQDIAASTEEQSAMSQEIAGSANELSSLAKSMQVFLQRFKIK